ncbi:S-layer homology domain-containing protein [Egicoccus halophilus]|uniref:SLH domain-containing protein n=1 Tax=Egicoccus halophilus TaxID=1670830 RepID=A0A8J3EUK8_9ACTN|nr:S-layer homology domain-containing protein [Egicoccus halophilus]GGI07908.1 hypothetical protein GCM10011354_26430 [Egicoccus halophilus]
MRPHRRLSTATAVTLAAASFFPTAAAAAAPDPATAAITATSTTAMAVAAPSVTIPGADRRGPDTWALPVDASTTLGITGLTDRSGAPLDGRVDLVVDDVTLDRAAFATWLVRASITAGMIAPDDFPSPAQVREVLGRYEDLDPSHPVARDLAFVIDRQLMSGQGDGTFRPEGAVTRAQAATMLRRMLETVRPLPDVAGGVFEDVPVHSAQAANIDALVASGVIVADGPRFFPANQVSSGAMTAWIQGIGSVIDDPVDAGPREDLRSGTALAGTVGIELDHTDTQRGGTRGVGPHEYQVVAAGLPATSFTVVWEGTGPSPARFTTVPRAVTISPYADLSWEADAAVATLRCRFGTWESACPASARYGGLPVGDHRFEVRGYAADGRHLVTLVHRWTISPPFDVLAEVDLTDVTGTHADNIFRVAGARIAAGYRDRTFRQDEHVTRAQMASFLHRALELPAGPAGRFSDVTGTHAAAIDAVAHAGIAQGYEGGTFRPDAAVTRGQMAAFLQQAFQYPAGPQVFRDIRGTTHENAIRAIAAAGVARGYEDGSYRPNTPVTRGHMATFLHNAMDR